jgi:uncharacterized lipoprotein YajG
LNPTLRLASLLLAAAALLLQGCAMKSQDVRLEPSLNVAPSSAGQSKVVWLQVRDVRLKKTLGIVGDLGGRYAYVSVEQDPSSTLYQSVSAGLRKMGFTVQPTPAGDARALRIEVRDLQYESVKQALSFNTEVKVALAAMADNKGDRYERMYNAGESKTSAFMPDAEENERTVNRVVGMALEEMLADGQLIALLAR